MAAHITDPAGPETAGAPAAQAVVPALAPTRDIVVIGASAGGVAALKQLAAGLPADCAAAIFVVNHISPEIRSELAGILGRAGPLPALQAEDGMLIEPGRILTAPSDRHLLLAHGHVRVVNGPRENRHRPAIDPLFRSAAWAYGPRVVGVVLTGHLDDGTAGLWAIKSCGGTTVVQDPADAAHPEMPANALTHNRVDHRLPLARIPALIASLAREPAGPPAGPPPPGIGAEVGLAALEGDHLRLDRLGHLSAFTCPTCRGALWEMDEGGHLRYRCHTGHAFSQASLQISQDIALEQSLYAALQVVEEKAAALRRLAERWPERLPGMRGDYENRARELDETALALRAMLSRGR